MPKTLNSNSNTTKKKEKGDGGSKHDIGWEVVPL
jgi:hypothetical protein